MKWFLFITFLVLELIVATNGSPSCPDNQVYLKCGTSDQYCDGKPRGCSAVCKEPGCYCEKGFMRAFSCNTSDCVKPSDCPDKCSGNEEYRSCGGCDKICNEKTRNCSSHTQDCRNPGCYCKKGYVRQSKDLRNCIKESECKQCKKYEVYKCCGNDPYCNEVRVSKKCKDGCFCEDGYKRSHKGGPCIPAWKCQQKQCNGENEVYNACGTCDQYCFAATASCGVCVPGCYCREGYIRATKDKCVLKSDCSKTKHHQGQTVIENTDEVIEEESLYQYEEKDEFIEEETLFQYEETDGSFSDGNAV